MAAAPRKKFKYSIHLAALGVTKLTDFLTENGKNAGTEIPLRNPLNFKCRLFSKPVVLTTPSWAKVLDNHFSVNNGIKSGSAAAVILFESDNRVMACTYGHGHTMIDSEKRENDFGLLVAANSLSDTNVKLVEKANLGSIIRDATQAAGITNLQEFNVDRALSLVRKLSGNSKDTKSSLSGSSSITLTSEIEISKLDKLGELLLELYKSKDYSNSAFAIIDKIKPVTDTNVVADLDSDLLDNINSDQPDFELGAPEIEIEPIGFITISGSLKRTHYADVTLDVLLEDIGQIKTVDDLHRLKIVTHSIDGTHIIKKWTVHQGLVGSLRLNNIRYALNEGKWYAIEEQLKESANSAFKKASEGLDKTFHAWPILSRGKRGNSPTYQREEDYLIEFQNAHKNDYVLLDQVMFPVPGTAGRGIESCDLFDIKRKKLIHLKKSGRRSSVISHFLAQGMNSAKLLRSYDDTREKFFKHLSKHVDEICLEELKDSFPSEWTVEFKFADEPSKRTGDYTIPFFSRISLDETKREIEALGYKKVVVSFVRLSQQAKKQ